MAYTPALRLARSSSELMPLTSTPQFRARGLGWPGRINPNLSSALSPCHSQFGKDWCHLSRSFRFHRRPERPHSLALIVRLPPEGEEQSAHSWDSTAVFRRTRNFPGRVNGSALPRYRRRTFAPVGHCLRLLAASQNSAVLKQETRRSGFPGCLSGPWLAGEFPAHHAQEAKSRAEEPDGGRDGDPKSKVIHVCTVRQLPKVH